MRSRPKENGNIANELNITSMKKFLLFFGGLLTAFSAPAQDLRQYVGNCLIYSLNDAIGGEIYAANIISASSDTNRDISQAASIFLHEDNKFQEYKTSYGYYKSFKFKKTSSINYPSEEQFVFFNRTAGGSCYYAFTQQNDNLYLVDLKTDAIISVFEGVGFCDNIFVRASGMDSTPNFYIMCNGYINYYISYPSNLSSVRSITTGRVNESRAYGLDGIEKSNPMNGIYVQDGKKIVINK